MGRLVAAMLQEWEVAMHNAAVAKNAQLQQVPGQETAQPPAEAAKQPEKPVIEDLHVVEDLVQDIREKPKEK